MVIFFTDLCPQGRDALYSKPSPDRTDLKLHGPLCTEPTVQGLCPHPPAPFSKMKILSNFERVSFETLKCIVGNLQFCWNSLREMTRSLATLWSCWINKKEQKTTYRPLSVSGSTNQNRWSFQTTYLSLLFKKHDNSLNVVVWKISASLFSYASVILK